MLALVVVFSGLQAIVVIPDAGVAAQAAPDLPPGGLLTPSLSRTFLAASQNSEENWLASLSDVYYLVGVLSTTGHMGDLSAGERAWLVDRVRSFQNDDGGFGDWARDRSTVGATLQALRTLESLGSGPLNVTGAETFLDRLQVSGLLYGNYGFRSSVKASDGDVSSTHDAVLSLGIIGAEMPNRTQLVAYLKDHQNLDGGFGYETNRMAGVFWDSTTVHTHRGVMALTALGEVPEFTDEAIAFLTGVQCPSGGFGNGPVCDARVAYTYNAVLALGALGVTVPNSADVVAFIKGNQLQDGGFLEHDLDTKEGIHTTYFAVRALEELGASYDHDLVASFARSFLEARLDGGFGNYPGLGSTTMFTFEAVSALNLIGTTGTNVSAHVAFLEGLANPDGGFGEDGVSDVETTFRTVLALQVSGEPVEDPDAVISFVRACQNDDGGFGFSKGYVSRTSYTYRALRALEILGSTPLDRAGALAYMRGVQNEDGGFGNAFGAPESEMASTYRAIRSLAILDGSPVDVDGAEAFILGSLNDDGGFRRSPTDLVYPGNLSTVPATYHAVVGLHFLGRGLADGLATYAYLDSLRNGDLGFGEREFQPSSVSDTFGALWALHWLYRDALNLPPVLVNGTSEGTVVPASQPARFSVMVSDPDGQVPEFVHLVVDGSRNPMRPDPDSPGTYVAEVPLSPGTHAYSFQASDGLEMTGLAGGDVRAVAAQGSPVVTLELDEPYGLEETRFIFTALVEDPDDDPLSEVALRVDLDDWVAMAPGGDGTYAVTVSLGPGDHTAVAMASDGVNVGISAVLAGPHVYARDADSPDWDTFLRIRALIEARHGVTVDYTAVTRAILDGELVWRVALPGGGETHVSNDGRTEVDRDGGDDQLPGGLDPPVLVLAALVVLVLIVGIAVGMRRRRGAG